MGVNSASVVIARPTNLSDGRPARLGHLFLDVYFVVTVAVKLLQQQVFMWLHSHHATAVIGYLVAIARLVPVYSECFWDARSA